MFNKKYYFFLLGLLFLVPTVHAESTSLEELVIQWEKEISFKNGTFEWGFTVLDNESPVDAEKRFYEEHTRFLNLQIQKARSVLFSRDANNDDRIRKRQLLEDVLDAKNSEIVFKKVETHPGIRSQGKQQYNWLERSYNNPWEPIKGSLNINQSYIENTFYFWDIRSFNPNRTYEHETQVYDTDYADYAWYWSSNMPNAYLDTHFLDGNIDNFTIGSSDTSAFESRKEYMTYMSLKPGTSNTAFVIVKWQIWHRTPNWCHSTWCIYADATSSRLTQWYAPFWISWVK